MLEELEHQVGGRPLPGPAQDVGDGGQCDRVETHPAGGVRLLKCAADRQVRAVERAEVVQPRNPPSKTLLPSLSSRLTHQVKLTSSLSKTRLRKSMSRPPSTANTSSAAQAWTGGFTSEKYHPKAGGAAPGGRETSH